MENFVSLNRIKENPRDKIDLICDTLIKIIDKIISDPNNGVARKLKIDSPEVFENLMPHSGAMELLFEIGFQEVLTF